MTKVIICFSAKGKDVIKKLNECLEKAGIDTAEEYICMVSSDEKDPAENVSKLQDLNVIVSRAFERRSAVIFVGAVGIAVRAVAPYVKDKLSDSPVIVIDDNASFVIPILSGHAGGANKLAVMISQLLDAIPVITTSTDANGAFSADVFASENSLRIVNRNGIKKVSAKAIEGKPITLAIKDYPPRESVDIIIAEETDREYSLLLAPRRYVVGLGMKKDKDAAKVEEFVLSALSDKGIQIDDVYAVATIDIKADEPAIRAFSEKYRIPVITFEAAVLEKVKGEFSSSDFVRKTVGVDNVCERAAVLAAGHGSELIAGKSAYEGITVAIARRI